MDTNTTSQIATIESSELTGVTGGGFGFLKPIAKWGGKQVAKWAPKAGKAIATGVVAKGVGAGLGALQHGVSSTVDRLKHDLISTAQPHYY